MYVQPGNTKYIKAKHPLPLYSPIKNLKSKS